MPHLLWLFGFMHYTRFLMLFQTLAIIFYSLVLTGCSTDADAIRNIYLTSLSYQNMPASTSDSSALVNPNLTATFAALVNNTSLEVRASYFGLCVLGSGGPQSWICGGDTASIARLYQPQQDPLNIIWASVRFKNGIVFSGLIIATIALAFIAICLLATFPGWHTETDDRGDELDVKPFPSKSVSQITLAATTLASLLALVSMMWQHAASVAAATTAQDLAYGAVNSKVGAATMALGWLGLAFLVISALGILVMVMSISLLDRVTDDM